MGCTQSTESKPPRATEATAATSRPSSAEEEHAPTGVKAATTPPRLTAEEIEQRVDCSDEVCNATFGGVKVRYAYLSQRGYYPSGE